MFIYFMNRLDSSYIMLAANLGGFRASMNPRCYGQNPSFLCKNSLYFNVIHRKNSLAESQVEILKFNMPVRLLVKGRGACVGGGVGVNEVPGRGRRPATPGVWTRGRGPPPRLFAPRGNPHPSASQLPCVPSNNYHTNVRFSRRLHTGA